MMVPRVKSVLSSPPVLLAAGLAVVVLVAFIMWVELLKSLSLRVPVPSPDGKYFAYFDLVKTAPYLSKSDFDLVVSTPHGRLISRFGMERGSILWSNADHLAILNENRNQARLIAESEGQFLVLTRLALSQGTEPRWSSDGTKLAYVRRGALGEEIAVYDVQQTLASAVPVPQGYHFQHPTLLSWSPGSQELFYLATEGPNAALGRVDIPSGTIQVLSNVPQGWKSLRASLPHISPGGSKIYLAPPLHIVIDAHTGETLWRLPVEAKVLWLPWSADGSRLFFSRRADTSEIYAHDFASRTDQLILAHTPSNGFFTLDERSYFYRTRSARAPGVFGSSARDWLRRPWRWEHVDMVTRSEQSLGRLELLPWEQTQDGWILAERDDYLGGQFGMYDPNGRVLSEFVLPTEREDLLRQVKNQGTLLLSVVLYALLAFFVYLKRPTSAPVRGLYVLSLVLMLLFASMGAADPALLTRPVFAYRLGTSEMASLGWLPLGPLYPLIFDFVFLYVISLALVPPALFHFAMVFPDGNRFLAQKQAIRLFLYGVSLTPLLGIVAAQRIIRAPEALRPLVGRSLLAAGPLAMLPALVALVYNYLHPPNRRAREQVRWMAIAFALPVAGICAVSPIVMLANAWFRLVGESPLNFLDAFYATTPLLWVFTPLAIGYALISHKPFDTHLFMRRALHYFLVALVVTIVFLLLVGGLGWAVLGSRVHPSTAIVMTSAFLTALIIVPVRSRLQSFIRRTFDRGKYEFREALGTFATGLPRISDGRILATRLSETVQKAMGARRFYLFVLDRQAKKLRPQPTMSGLPAGRSEVEFDPAEPLCRYLLEKGRPFEVEVSPYDTKLAGIYHHAATRFSQLEAAVVFGLRRRDELLGLMILGQKASEEFYNAEDLQSLKEVADQVSVALANADLFQGTAPSRDLS